MRSFLCLAGLLLVAGCGGAKDSETRAATPSPSPEPAAAGTPFPSGFGASLHAGTTYSSQVFEPALRITPAAGRWVAEIGEQPDDFSVAKRGIDGQAILAFHRVRAVFDPEKGGDEPADRVAAPDDFAAWLTSHPHLKASAPRRVERLGLEGVRIDVRPVSYPKTVPSDCGRLSGHCVPVLYDGVDLIFYGEGTRARFYVLEQPGGEQLVVEEYFTPASMFRSQRRALDRTLQSAELVG